MQDLGLFCWWPWASTCMAWGATKEFQTGAFHSQICALNTFLWLAGGGRMVT